MWVIGSRHVGQTGGASEVAGLLVGGEGRVGAVGAGLGPGRGEGGRSLARLVARFTTGSHPGPIDCFVCSVLPVADPLHICKLDDGWPESVEEQGLLLLVWRHQIRNNILKMCYMQSRRGVLRQNSRKVQDNSFCIANTFTHRSFYTQKLLHTKAFTHRSFYRQTLSHTDPFTHRRLYTQKLLDTEAFTHRRFYTDTFNYTQSFYPQKLLQTEAFTHIRFYTYALTHRYFYTTETFTHRRLYTQRLLHTEAFIYTQITHRRFYTTDSFTH